MTPAERWSNAVGVVVAAARRGGLSLHSVAGIDDALPRRAMAVCRRLPTGGTIVQCRTIVAAQAPDDALVGIAAPAVTVENTVEVPARKVIARQRPDGAVEMVPE